MKTRKEDQGTSFGTWTDPVSRFMYEESLREYLPLMDLRGRVVDYGGANGLFKKVVPQAVTVDNDPSKNPDVVDDILTHGQNYDAGFCRFVLHYLTDQQVIQFVSRANVNRLYVSQFVNQDLRGKYANSRGEGTKYFRTFEQTKALLGPCEELWRSSYQVGHDFYLNRLGIEGAVAHEEEIVLFKVFG